MDYLKIFNDIVEITHHDYAGFIEKKGWDNPNYFRKVIIELNNKKTLNPQSFTKIVNDYLDIYRDRHMFFTLDETEIVKNQTIGFQVRRYEDVLYVIDANEENRLKNGDVIKSIDGKTIPVIASEKVAKIRGKSAERQEWNRILNDARSIELLCNKKHICLELKKYNVSPKESKYTIKNIDANTLLLTLSDLNNYEEITGLIRKYHNHFNNCLHLIIDLRKNSGGNANSISPLLPFIFPKTEKPSSEQKVRQFNCTNRNVDLFKKQVDGAKKFIDDTNTLKMLQDTLNIFESSRGKGFVTLDFTEYIEDLESSFIGNENPRQIIILTDYYCASAAEEFVEVAKESSKVTIIGRATMGINDYSDLVQETWEGLYSLNYPISRLKENTTEHPIHGKGIKPDHYIKWTPEHIYEDIDLIKALDILSIKN